MCLSSPYYRPDFDDDDDDDDGNKLFRYIFLCFPVIIKKKKW